MVRVGISIPIRESRGHAPYMYHRDLSDRGSKAMNSNADGFARGRRNLRTQSRDVAGMAIRNIMVRDTAGGENTQLCRYSQPSHRIPRKSTEHFGDLRAQGVSRPLLRLPQVLACEAMAEGDALYARFTNED